jgi:hypothetical protein
MGNGKIEHLLVLLFQAMLVQLQQQLVHHMQYQHHTQTLQQLQQFKVFKVQPEHKAL